MSIMATGRVVVVMFSVVAGLQSGKPTLETLLDDMRAANWNIRSSAVEQIARDREMWRAAATRIALIQLIDRETRLFRDPNRVDSDVTGAYGEAYLEYYGKLVDRVDSLVDSSDVASVAILV